MQRRERAWCAKIKAPGDFLPLLFGTVFAENEHEAEVKLRILRAQCDAYQWEWLAILPGQLVFIGGDDAAA
jgi:hypothetical protein